MLSDYLAKAFELQRFAAAVSLVLLVGSCSVSSQTKQSLPQNKRQVAVTFDDLPGTHGDYEMLKYVTENLMAKLKSERVPTTGFVNEFKLQTGAEGIRRTALLRQWLDNGHDLGNHSFSHVSIDRSTVDQYAADVIRGEPAIKKLLTEKGKSLKYYRHTQLRTGPTEEYRRRLAQLLKERGYTVAPVTVDNNDHIFAQAYSAARRANDNALRQKIGAEYLIYMESVFHHFEKLSVEFLGYEVKQTLLLHANELNADYFDRLAQMLKKRGYGFITLDEALSDKAYQLPEAQSKRGLSWLHRWMIAKGLPMKEEPLQPDWIDKLSRQNSLR